MKFTSVLMTSLMLMMMSAPTMCMAAGQPTVNLGTTAGFAILLAPQLTNTGIRQLGSVGSDVGLSPGNVFIGKASVTMVGQFTHS